MSVKTYKERVVVGFGVIFFIAVILICRLVYIQLLSGQKMKELASASQDKLMNIEMKRGTIYDSCQRELAVSIEVDSLYASPKDIKCPEAIADKLAPIIQMKRNQIVAMLKKKSSFVWIKRKLTARQASQIAKLNLPFVGFIKEYKRRYPKGELGAHILGFAGIDNCGLEGVELSFDKSLKGPTKSIVLTRDANGRIIVDKKNMSFFSDKGCDITLTIDEVIQYAAEAEIRKTCLEYNALGGCAIVMNPKTGEILALASYPAYNPNYFSNYPTYCRRNKAISDVLEPGSTFKPLIAACLLEEGVISPFEEFYCSGQIYVGKKIVHCAHVHDKVSFAEVISKSCNIGMIQSVKRLSSQKLYSYFDAFGLTKPTGIELPGEEGGILSKPSQWSKLSMAVLSMGQGISTTPIQLSAALAAIANDGILMKPMIVKTIKDSKNKIIKSYQPIQVRRVVSANTARNITKLLKKAVDEGTGVKAQIDGYAIAGKTGTAQKVVSGDKGYSKDKYIASFIGYLPADDPQILIAVIIDEPKTSEYWGGTVAAPVFKEISKRVLPYLHLLPDSNIRCGSSTQNVIKG
ncbi:MAG: penicillin-binding protein 2 [bacterium]